MKRYVFAVTVLLVAVVSSLVWLPGRDGDPGPTLPEVVASDDFDPTPVAPQTRPARPRTADDANVPSPASPQAAPDEPPAPVGHPVPARTPQRTAGARPGVQITPGPSASPPPTDPETQLARIRQAMDGATPRFRACYLDLLREYPDVTDRLLLRLAVARDEETGRGVPSLVGIESSDLAGDELDCFADVLVGLPFPPPIPDEDGNLEPYTITYPVVLAAEP